jgi:glycosyltransferase involved in cell wall biosynthesis
VLEAVFAIPGDLATPTGGYAYDRRLLALLPRDGVVVTHRGLPGGFPFPDPQDLAGTARLLADTPRDAVVLIDGLAFGALPATLVRDLGRRVVALVHHPLGLETGHSADVARALLASEAAALAVAHAVIVTSPATARILAADLGVAPERITVAVPGTDPAPRAAADGDPPRLLTVGTISPRKAQTLLVEALAGLDERDWSLTVVGATDRHPDEADRLRGLIAASGLADRVRLSGALPADAVARAYAEADLFVLPSLYEGFGMVITEALAHGLPVVATTGGVAVESLPAQACLRVPPGDVAALREALRSLIDDAGRRRGLAEAAWAAAQDLPRWTQTSRIVADVIRRVAS